MSIQSIFNKLTLDEIKELSESMIKHQPDFFGNSLKQSEQYAYISQIFGIKDWNTLSGLKKVKDVYPCPSCSSLSLRMHSDSVTEYTLDEKGDPKEVISVEDTGNVIYFCSKCMNEDIEIIFSYEYKGKIINLKSMFEYFESYFNLKKIAYTKECDIDLTKEHIHTKVLNILKDI